jgi:hypothetical protein
MSSITRVARGRVTTPLSVYDGQQLIGEIEDRGRRTVIAYRFHQRRRMKVGTFPTRIEAMRAVAKPAPERAVGSGE